MGRLHKWVTRHQLQTLTSRSTLINITNSWTFLQLNFDILQVKDKVRQCWNTPSLTNNTATWPDQTNTISLMRNDIIFETLAVRHFFKSIFRNHMFKSNKLYNVLVLYLKLKSLILSLSLSLCSTWLIYQVKPNRTQAFGLFDKLKLKLKLKQSLKA